MSLLHFPSPSRSTEEQKDVMERFKTLVVSLGLRSPLTETSVDMDKIAEEVSGSVFHLTPTDGISMCEVY